MLLIELFTDYIYNQKDLREYVQKRKSIDERGEFNDAQLLEAADQLERLKKEEPKIYDLMYETLREYVRLDRGHTMEYPINFIREILKLSKDGFTPQDMYEEYKSDLEHYHHDT